MSDLRQEFLHKVKELLCLIGALAGQEHPYKLGGQAICFLQGPCLDVALSGTGGFGGALERSHQ